MQKRHLTEFNTSLIKTIIKLGVKGHFLTLNSIHENPIASIILGASQVALEVKNLSADAGDLREAGSIPGLVGKIPWRRMWQPTPVFLPGESYGQRRLVGYSLWVTESDMTEVT